MQSGATIFRFVISANEELSREMHSIVTAAFIIREITAKYLSQTCPVPGSFFRSLVSRMHVSFLFVAAAAIGVGDTSEMGFSKYHMARESQSGHDETVEEGERIKLKRANVWAYKTYVIQHPGILSYYEMHAMSSFHPLFFAKQNHRVGTLEQEANVSYSASRKTLH